MSTSLPVPIAHLTTLGLGGPAWELAEARTDDDLIHAVRDADARGLPVLVLGGGSNLVVSDRGFPGRVVRVLTRGVATDVLTDRVLVRAAAGEPWDPLVDRTVSAGLAGLECLSGIPGLVGATPIQNVGAYGQEVSDTLVDVRAYDRLARAVVTLDRARCGFGYRDSVFKRAARGRYVVLEATFALTPPGTPQGAPVRYAELARALAAHPAPGVAEVRAAVLALRRARSMVLDPGDPESRSVGSFFTNPVVSAAEADEVARRARALGVLPPGESMPRFPADDGAVKLAAGWLIERAGVARGTALGGVAVSRRHALALVHHGGGTATELVTLARHIQAAVRAAFGVGITPEPVFAGFDSDDPVSAP